MGSFKDLEIEELEPGYVDPNQLALFGEESSSTSAAAPRSEVPSAPTNHCPQFSAKHVRYIEQFLAQRLKVS